MVLFLEGNDHDQQAAQALLQEHGFSVSLQREDRPGLVVQAKAAKEDLPLAFMKHFIEGIVILDAETAGVLYANSAFAEMLGYSLEEVHSLKVWDWDAVWSPEDLGRMHTTRNWPGERFETRHRRKNGEVLDVAISHKPNFWRGKEVVFCLVRDIREYKQKEQALQLNQFAMDSTFDQAFRITPEGCITYVNKAACAALGYSREELVGMSVSNIDSNFCSERLAETWESLKAEKFRRFESCHKAKDGRIYPVEIRSNYANFDGQEFRLAFVTDISERKAAEAALRRSEERYRQLMKMLPIAAYTTDSEGRITFYNRKAEELWKRAPKLHMDLWCGSFKLHYPDGRPMAHDECPMAMTVKTGEAWQGREIMVENPDGSRSFALAYPEPLVGSDGKTEGAVNLLFDITERKMAERQMRQANLVLENSPVIIFRWKAQPGWPVEMVSRNIISFGYTPEELLSGAIPYADLVHPEDLNQVATEVEEHTGRGDERFQQEYRVVTKGGEIRWVSDCTFVERDTDGRLTHYQGILMDTTDRKQAEEALRESESRYRSIVEHAPFGFTRSTRDGQLLSVNPALASILKYDSVQDLQETIARSSIQEVLFPKPSDREALVKQILFTGSWQVYNNRLRCKDGTIVTCRVHSRRLVDGAGQISAFESYQENITHQLEAEQALQESEEKFRVLAETSSVAICIYQGERIIYANPAMERLFGYSAAELSQMNFLEVVHEEYRELVRERGLARLEGKSVPSQYEFKYRTRAGEEGYVLSSVGTMEYLGRLTRVASLIDISERKETEGLLRTSLVEKEVLLKEIHHRVKNNLQVVSSLLFLQAQRFSDPDLQNCFLESQSRICSMALAHEQLYQSKNLAEISVKSYVESLVGQLEQIFQSPEQKVDCRLVVEDLPLDIEKVVPCGLLITELLSNVYKHAFADGRSGQVTISLQSDAGQIELAVVDNGVGLPAGFDCRQAKTFGLQLVTALINQLDGDLEINSRNGTRFGVRFAG